MHTTATAAPSDADYPPRARAWLAVGLLTLAYAISLLDRWILTLLVAPVKAHFSLTDTQIGLLMGPAFALLYVGLGLPFGWLADRYSRRAIIAAGMSFWCTATTMCGLAQSYLQLALARFGVGIGEAALTPAANSMIADYFPRAEQSRAISIFNMGVSTGMGFAYIAGGFVVAWMSVRPALELPVVGELASWQVVFIAVGLPGLLVALLISALPEPVRRGRLARSEAEATLRQCMRYIVQRWKAYVPLAVGMGCSPLVGYAFNWLPEMFRRVHGWEVGRFAGSYGWILLVFGPAGAIAAGWLSTRLYRAGRTDAPYIATILALVLLVIAGGLMPLAPTPEVALALLVPATVGGAMSTAAGAAAAVFVTPGEFRARVTALYVITISVIGLFLGPTLPGVLNDRLFTAPDGVRYSLACVVLGIGSLLTVILVTGRRAYAAAVAQLEQAQRGAAAA
jgi:MFS family permease